MPLQEINESQENSSENSNTEEEIDINKITPKLYRIIKQFAPFGPKNRTPN